MKKLIIKILLLSVPVLLYLMFIIIVDPFNYFGLSDYIPYEVKKSVTTIENPALFNLIEFNHHPSENITISDSRFAGKNLPLIENRTGMKFSELFIFDGMIKDLISGFWFANSRVKLKKVFISLNFNNFFVTQRNDLVKSSETVINDPLHYIANLNVLKASINCLRLANNHPKDTSYYIPKEYLDINWKRFLSVTDARYYKNYSYPDEYLKLLCEIKAYCNKESIGLYFIIPPTHVDMQNLVDINNLKLQKEIFVKDISKISTTYDLDFSNDLTNERKLFFDPVHLNKDKLSELFINIVNNQSYKDSALIKEYNLLNN